MEVAEPAKRRYRMGARAEATAATRRSIADTWLTLIAELPYDEITLDLVAARAGVTVQTVIRHFGSKDELFAAVAQEAAAEEGARRAAAPVGDPVKAIRALLSSYERLGDVVLRLLAQEDRLPLIREILEGGRLIHYEWVDRAFAPYLDGLPAAQRHRRHGQLVALTDVYVWKLLRRDLGFGRRQAEVAIAEMVAALLDGER